MTRLLRIVRDLLWATVVVILVAVAAVAWWPEPGTADVPPPTTTTVPVGRLADAVGLGGPAGVGMGDVHATGHLPAGAQVRKALGGLSLPDPFDGLEGTVTVVTVAALAVTTLLTLTLIYAIVRSPR